MDSVPIFQCFGFFLVCSAVSSWHETDPHSNAYRRVHRNAEYKLNMTFNLHLHLNYLPQDFSALTPIIESWLFLFH